MKITEIDGVAAILILLGIIIIVTENNIGWALIVLGILKQFWK